MEKILAIDDSKLVRDMLKGLLGQNRFAVDVACSAKEGLFYLDREDYDLAIIDYMLPEMNGLQILKILKENKPAIPVIILTSKGNEGIAVQAMKMGAIDYVIKSPDFIVQLPLTIRQAIKKNKEALEADKAVVIPEEKNIDPPVTGENHILIIDDNDVMVNLINQILHLNNFETTTAKSGSECLDLIASKPDGFNMILINFLLPDMNGLQLMEKLNKLKNRIPVILLSSKGSETIAVKAMKLGAIDYIVKQPGYLESLPEMIHTNIENFLSKESGKKAPHEIVEIKEKIYVLSNREDFCKDTKKYLTNLSYDMDYETEPDVFLQELFMNSYDLAIIDSDYPSINGIDVMDSIRDKKMDIPVIFIDKKWHRENAFHSMEKGAAEYIIRSEGLQGLLSQLIKKNVEYHNNIRSKENLETEVHRKNSLLNTKLKELKSLNDIARYIVENMDIEKSLYNIIGKISEIVYAERISIMIFDEKNNSLTIQAAKGFTEDDAAKVKVPVGQGISGYVAQTGKALFIPDIEKNPQFKKKNSPQYTHHSFICVPLYSKNEIIGVINVSNKRDSGTFTIEDFDIVSNFANYVAIAIENSKQYMEVKTLALIDDLTGCYNKRFFNSYIEKEIERSYRYKRALSIIMIDIDKFKDVNDTYGHYAGDMFLQEFCKLVLESIRLPDIFIRYGGEEFIIILPDTEDKKAMTFADRVRANVESHQFLPDIMKGKTVTISVGVAAYRRDITPRGFIENVDNALYEAKFRGRNQVCLFKSAEEKEVD